jgi:flavin-dependent dehydrogenase
MEVSVVGAGPAGLVAAMNLARAGYKVKVYEEKPDVGHRFNGDFQGLENWSSEEDVVDLFGRLGIDSRNYICRPYHSLTLIDAELRKETARSERPVFYLVKRGGTPGCLDHGIMEQAIGAGVEIAFGERIEKLRDGGIVGIGPRAADAIAKGMVFRTTMEDMAAVILDDRVAPKGYAYLLVHNGQATMATCMFRDFKMERECFERTVDAFEKAFPTLDIMDAKEFGGYGNFFFGKPAFENKRYYVGEAAGLQDCLWGFGIRYAVKSGYLAARAVIENRDYQRLLNRELIPMQRTSLVNRFIFERLGNRGYAYLIDYLTRGDSLANARKHYNPSVFKGILYPIAGWRYNSRLIDKGCHSEGCTCVWCRCGKGRIC